VGKQTLIDVRYLVGGADLSGQSNQIELSDSMEERSVTNFRSGGARELVAGLEQVEINAEGQWEVGDPGRIDDALWASRRVVEPHTVAPNGESDLSAGSVVYLTRAARTSATLFGEVGEVAPWTLQAAGSWPLVRGRCLHPSGVPRSGDGVGQAFQFPAMVSGQAVYATLHVLSAAGTGAQLEVRVESSGDEAFTSPQVRGEFEAAPGVGGQAIKLPTLHTDTWYRVGYTVTGTNPSFLFLVALGIA